MPASSYVNREHVGGAADTEIVGDILSSSLSIVLDNPAGWPTGGANGPFHIIIDYDVAGREKVEVQSRTGNTLTIADTGKRGVDGTTAAGHNSGALIRHCVTAIDIQESNDHITNGALDHHLQYMRADGTRHDLTARHAVGTVIPATGTPTTIDPDDTASNGVGSSVARVDHQHAIATAAASSIGTSNSEGVSSSFARADHGHDLLADSVGSAEIVNGSVGTDELAALAVTTDELANDAVTAAKAADGIIDDPAKIVNAIVTLAKIASEISTDWAPAAADFATGATLSLGTGGTRYGHYFKVGRVVAGWCGWNMAADGNLPSPGKLVVPLPVPMRTVGADGFRCFTAARIRRASDGFVASGTAVITSGSSQSSSPVTTGVSAEWDSTTPFNPGTPGDGACSFDALFFYEAAT